MEMDVNLVKCLRSTVGMSDIDRCYNEFILNGINQSSPVIHHNQHLTTTSSGGITIPTSSSIRKGTATTVLINKPIKNISSTFASSSSSKSSEIEIKMNHLNNNDNQFNYKSYKNMSSQQYISSMQSSTSSLSSSSLSSTSTSTSTSSSPSPSPILNRKPPATISGMLVRNNEMANNNVHSSNDSSSNNNNIDNGNDDNDDDVDNNDELNSSNNIIYDNRIDYQYYQYHSYNQNSKAKNKKSKNQKQNKIKSTTAATTAAATTTKASPSILGAIQQTPSTPISKGCCIALSNRNKINKTPQEIYFESRGKSCKKLLKFNGYSNKILLYPEESWARSAASSYWTIKPSWWQPNRCKVTEITGSQRYSTKAKMLCIEKGSLLVMGSFKKKLGDSDFKLYLSSNITMEDYNMGYCLTGWVERRCSQTNTFQMTHFAVIKRQWPPSINSNTNANTNDSKSN
ncbi:homeobox protein 2 [Condylostylus longicornis]|uniref:homeobox protein 2 n=1 Tax=Condylostylus longicornis TaxID=2530218 RepID=UPI00244DBAD1|nr:homeobox protein 2 [Condylostylus longicornis]